MSDKPVLLWEQMIAALRWRVAKFAIRFCGLPDLYWAAPAEWEEYMTVGEPYVKPQPGQGVDE